ncbi:MAG: hypothetical protein KDC67_04385, partial [Ignavibacteriae bacterium]|nr:hypothetical protein [Ignavibacteriota bacterium]
IDNITNNTTYFTLDVTSKSSVISGTLSDEVLYKIQIQISTDKSLQQNIDTINVDLSTKADLVGGYVTPAQLDKTDALDVDDSTKIATAKAAYNLKQLVDVAQGNTVVALDQILNINGEITTLNNEIDLKENGLGNPVVDDYVLSSKSDGTRIWVNKGVSYTDITWENLLIQSKQGNTEQGQLFDIKGSVNTTRDYGKIIFTSQYTFDVYVNGITETIYLNQYF